MKIPKIVTETAEKHGLNGVSFVGEYKGARVFIEKGVTDEDGFPVPTGLPVLILLKDGKTEVISGLKALELLDRFE